MFQTNEMIVLGFLGETGVGKTHIIHRYLVNSLPEKMTSTIAVEFATGFYQMEDGTKLKLKIWDTSGQDKYKQIVCYHLKQVQGIVLVYDVSNEASFQKIDEWLQRLERQQLDDCPLFLIANKSDLPRKVSKKAGESKAQQLKAQYFQLSSFDQQQVTEVVNEIIQALIQKKADNEIMKKQKDIIISKQQQLPLGIEDSGAADAVCSNCELY